MGGFLASLDVLDWVAFALIAWGALALAVGGLADHYARRRVGRHRR